jgi:Cathepsin propeptide inhibitor domain (I29)
MKVFMLLVFVMALVALPICEPQKPQNVPTEEQIAIFKEWKEKFSKDYATEAEENEAIKKLLKNNARIEIHNKKFEEGEVTFTRGLFKYSDFSSAEKRKFLTGLAVPPSEQAEHTARSLLPEFPPGPETVNWIEKNLVGPIVDY